jgi:hypothetical protein
MRTTSDIPKVVYWHRDLPPLDADVVAEHTVEAVSARVSGRLTDRDEVWDRCYVDLMSNTTDRLEQEVKRLGGQYAHIVDEAVDSRHDEARNESWLHGRFDYVLYRKA